jgi:Domain of unknown function (DUF4349)
MRLRDEETPSAEVERDLAALDAALEGKPVSENEAIAELARDLRAERPVPDSGFTQDLDARAAEGFRGAGGAGPFARLRERLAATPPRRVLAPAGAFVTLAVVAVVALSQYDGGEDSATLTVEPAEQPSGPLEQAPADDAVPGQAPDADGAAEPGSAAPEIAPGEPAPPVEDFFGKPGRNGLAPGQEDRKVERAAQITLSADEDEVPEVADGVIEVSDRHEGIVISSQVSESAEGGSSARIELAIPAESLSDALADLSELADVSSRNESTLDITEPFVSARERLADARAELDSLLTQLAGADTPRETRSIRARMEIVRGEIATVRAELESISRRARYASVSVSVQGDGGNGGWSLGDAAEDALDVLRTSGGIALVSAAVLVPLAAIAVIAWLIARAAFHRRREHSLD